MRRFPTFLLLLVASILPLSAQNPVGPERAVSQTQAGAQWIPDVGVAADGSFVVVWEDTKDLIQGDVKARRFGPSGRPRGGELRVSRLGRGHQGAPSVAVHPDGSFVVVWVRTWNHTPFSGRQPEIYASRFDADGQAAGKPRLVAFAGRASDREQATVVALPDGGFFVAWSLEDGGVYQEGDLPSRDVYGRRFTRDGVLVGGRVTLNAETPGDQSLPECALDRGQGLACTWTNDQGEGSFGEIAFRRFDLNGHARADEVQVNPEESFFTMQFSSALAVDEAGTALVLWHDPHFDPATDALPPESDEPAVLGRLISSSDQFITPAFRVHSTTRGQQVGASAAATPEGFVAVWASTAGEDGSGSTVLLRTLAADGTFTSGERIVNLKRAGYQGQPQVAFGPGGGAVAWSTAPTIQTGDVAVRRLHR